MSGFRLFLVALICAGLTSAAVAGTPSTIVNTANTNAAIVDSNGDLHVAIDGAGDTVTTSPLAVTSSDASGTVASPQALPARAASSRTRRRRQKC